MQRGHAQIIIFCKLQFNIKLFGSIENLSFSFRKRRICCKLKDANNYIDRVDEREVFIALRKKKVKELAMG